MAQYTKSTGDNGSVRYKDGGRFVKADDVPANIKEALDANPEGTAVDELGEVVNPETDTDEGTGDDDSVPTNTTPAEDDSTADDADEGDAGSSVADTGAGDDGEDDEEEEPEAPATPAPAKRSAKKQEIGGMGFPAKNGKTLSIFSDKPHETVKNVGGILVPLTNEELTGDVAKGVEPKTDTEIIEKLKKLGKL